MAKFKIIIPISVTVLITIILGMSLKISYLNLLMLALYSSLFEIVVFLFLNKSLKTKFTLKQTLDRFKEFLKYTKFVQMLLLLYFIVRLFLGLDSKLILFYSHIFIVFNAVGYILCICDIDLKRKR